MDETGFSWVSEGLADGRQEARGGRGEVLSQGQLEHNDWGNLAPLRAGRQGMRARLRRGWTH